MQRIERQGSNSVAHPWTAKELVHGVGRCLSTLNFDIHITRDMPSILPGEQGIKLFTESLRRSHFVSLAEAIEIVHSGQKRDKKGKRFPNKQESEKFRVNSKVITDMAFTLRENADLLDQHMATRNGTYRGDETRVGELVLTFYELVLGKLKTDSDTYPANQRASTLSQVPSFACSPLMQRVNQNNGAIVAQIV